MLPKTSSSSSTMTPSQWRDGFIRFWQHSISPTLESLVPDSSTRTEESNMPESGSTPPEASSPPTTSSKTSNPEMLMLSLAHVSPSGEPCLTTVTASMKPSTTGTKMSTFACACGQVAGEFDMWPRVHSFTTNPSLVLHGGGR